MIQLIVLDVDGCLSDGKITYDSNGNELKNFNVKDGLGIATWTKKMGKKAAIITGRSSSMVKQRANDLMITDLYQDCKNKPEILEQLIDKYRLSYEEVAVIGDDLNDYGMLKRSGFSFCPSDAVETIKKSVDCVSNFSGGNGAIREMIEIICKRDGIYEEFLASWL